MMPKESGDHNDAMGAGSRSHLMTPEIFLLATRLL